MIKAALRETFFQENRVALAPSTIKKFASNDVTFQIETGAGINAGFRDKEYIEAGVKIMPDAEQTLKGADFLFKVHAPSDKEWQILPDNIVVIADFRTCKNIPEDIVEKRNLTLFALEKMPRISRAQNMDILSSQDNLAGYKAVLEAANKLNRAVPMMTTAAGSVPPIKVLVLGVGVAGLQAIATAKRLGAVVSAFDVRKETEEQALSLGARFLQNSQIEENIQNADIIITAAGSAPNAPILISEKQIALIKNNAVAYDLSGNIDNPQKKENRKTDSGAEIIFNPLTAALLPLTASVLYANNLCNFSKLIQNPKVPDFTDEIIDKTCIYHQGKRR